MSALLAPWLTRQPLADRIAAWALNPPARIVSGMTDYGLRTWPGAGAAQILEPSAGRGAIALGLLKQPDVVPGSMTLIELERGRVDFLRKAFPMCRVVHRDFLSWEQDLFEDGGPSEAPFHLCVSNPPSDDGTDTEHVDAMTHVADRVVALVRLAFVTGSGREARIFQHCKLTRQVVLVNRPTFEDHRSLEERRKKSGNEDEADGSPKHDWTIVELVRMTGRAVGWTRHANPVDHVHTERWEVE